VEGAGKPGEERVGLSEWVWKFDVCPSCRGERVNYHDESQVKACPSCGRSEQYNSRYEWRRVQALRQIVYGYMPGKYYFGGRSGVEVFRLYLRELPREGWLGWVGHDYAVARLRFDDGVKREIRRALDLLVEKMRYRRDEVEDLLARLEGGREGLLQAPRMVVEAAVKKLVDEWICTGERDAVKTLLFGQPNYQLAMYDLYRHYRWRGDWAGCWCVGEVLRKLFKAYDGSELPYSMMRYDKLVFIDYEEDVIAGVKRQYDLKLRTVEWHLMQAYALLYEARNVECALECLKAIASALGYETVYSANYGEEEVLEKAGDLKLKTLYSALKPPLKREEAELAGEAAELFTLTYNAVTRLTGRSFPLTEKEGS
jgi:hypothetical protein